MASLRPFVGSFIAALVSLAACGGKVVVDAPTGGAGGSGSGGSGSTGTPTGPSTGTSTADLCTQLCSFWDAVACPMMDCNGQCAALFQEAGPCTDDLAAAIQCILDHPNEGSMCQMPVSCIDAINAYQDCVSPSPPPPCGDETCVAGSNGSCECTSVCSGSSLDVKCSSGKCSCAIDGALVGACADNGATCSVTASCCANFFFPQGG